MAATGLRERKKVRTSRLIADTAARLFAEHGFEQVTVGEVAREPEVAEARPDSNGRHRRAVAGVR
jgi:Bacterial regulatory proteins, tetR family